MMMVRSCLLLVLLASLMAGEAAMVIRHPDLELALAAAREDGRPVLAVFLKSRSPFVTTFEEVFFRRAAALTAGPLHAVVMDVDQHPQLAEQFRIAQLPSQILLAPEGYLLGGYTGLPQIPQQAAWLRQAAAAHAAGAWWGLHGSQASAGDLLDDLAAQELLPRLLAGQSILEDPARAVPRLSTGLDHPLLAVRVGSARWLRRLYPDSPQVDPWAAAEARGQAAAAWRSWWQAGGRPAPEDPVSLLDPELLPLVDGAVLDLRRGTPLERTQAMSILVQLGPGALTVVPQTWAQEEDAAALAAEVVRWAILVPAELEERTTVRALLARGGSSQRQDTAARLGAAGMAALPALTALLEDPDPLVREAALRAVASLGGPQALSAMAALLQSPEANLRMVAAQQLGQSRTPTAATFLADSVADDNELVAVAAIAAIEEAKGNAQATALIAALDDPRWRVRAAAAKALGGLRARAAVPALNQRLEDADGFVVRESLAALRRLSSSPPTDTLRVVAERHPGLAGAVCGLLLSELDGKADTSRQAVLDTIYRQAPAETRAAIWQVIADENRASKRQDHYLALYEQAMADDDASVRAAAAGSLGRMAKATQVRFLPHFLNDTALTVRREAAAVVVIIQTQVAASTGTRRPRGTTLASIGRLLFGGRKSATTQTPTANEPATAWYRILLEHREAEPEPLIALALFASAPDPVAALDHLRAALAVESWNEAWPQVPSYRLAQLLVRRLPPQGLDLIDPLLDDTDMHDALLSKVELAHHDSLRARIMDHSRILERLAINDGHADATILKTLVRRLRASSNHPLNLAGNHPAARSLLAAIAQSPASSAQTLTAFIRLNPFGLPDRAVLENALVHSEPWVRFAAVQAAIRRHHQGDEPAPLLAALGDEHLPTACLAAWGLLHESLRELISLPWDLRRFHFHSASLWLSGMSTTSHGRATPPFRPQAPVPEAVTTLLARLDSLDASAEHLALLRRLAAILAAQHGDNSALDAERQAWRGGGDADDALLLVALMITHDPIYLPVLERRLHQEPSSEQLRRYLTYLAGMRGREARALRRAINERLRRSR